MGKMAAQSIGPRNFDDEFGLTAAKTFTLFGTTHEVIAEDSALYAMKALAMQKRATELGITADSNIDPTTSPDQIMFGLEAKIDILCGRVPTLEPFRQRLLSMSQANLDAILAEAGVTFSTDTEEDGNKIPSSSLVLEGEYSISSEASLA